jgi:hypothetical protein
MIHIATDVVLITMLFVYINNKSKAANDAVEELREYTEEQIDNINNKLDNLIKYVMKQKQQPPPQIQRQPQPIQQVQPKQSKPQPIQQVRSQPLQQVQPQKVQKTVKFSDQNISQEQVKPSQPVIKTNSLNAQLNQIDEFINSIPQSIAFISTTQYPPQFVNQSQSTQIEIVNEEDTTSEEENTQQDDDNLQVEEEETDETNQLDDLDDLDMQEIENALSGDVKVSNEKDN